MNRSIRLLFVPMLALLCHGGLAHAEGPVPFEESGSSAASPVLPASTCTLNTGTLSSVSLGWTSPDAFSTIAWRIPSCASCAGQSLQMTSVSFRVRWVGACTAHVRVSLVATEAGDCGRPDTTRTYGTSFVQQIVGGSVGVVHTIALPADFCAPAGSFLRLQFLDLGSCYPAGSLSPPITVATSTCTTCQQFFSTTATHPALTEWCNIDTTGTTHPLWMEVTADCCANVGVERVEDSGGSTLTMLTQLARPIRMAMRLAGTAPRSVDVGVFDVAGRRIRTLVHDRLAGGVRSLEWDGRADSGQAVRPGVYRVRLRDGGRTVTASAILVD